MNSSFCFQDCVFLLCSAERIPWPQVTEGRRVPLCVKHNDKYFRYKKTKIELRGEIEKFKVKVGDFRALFRQFIEHADTAETQ